MSGHSHYDTIKRKKGAMDAAKGKIFSKMSRAIQVAIKGGGGADPNTNYKLRMAIDLAKASNMPKSNIDRILARSEEAGALEEVTYEGFGPEGIGVVVDVATDNKNRTAQSIKNVFERGGGSLAGPGAVSHNFVSKGLIVIKKDIDVQTQMLKLIDVGVEDLEESQDAIEAYVAPQDTGLLKDKLEKEGFQIERITLIKKPKTYISITDVGKATKTLNFLEMLEDQDDVQDVYANVDIPEEVANQINL